MKSQPCRHLAMLLVLLVLAACAEQALRPEAGSKSAASTDTTSGQMPPIVTDEVERLLALAARSPDPATASEARLDALAELLHRNEVQRAHQVYEAIEPTRLDPRQRLRHALLGARLDLEDHRPLAALQRMQQFSWLERSGDSAMQIELALVRADVFAALDRHLDAAHERALIQPWLRDDAQRRDNARAILASLGATDMASLDRAIGAATREDWRGWLELATLARDLRRGPRAQRVALDGWSQRYGTLAALQSATDMLATIRDGIHQPARVALLLPLSGEAAAAGLAVLHGYLAAHLQQLADGETPPPVAVLDTAASPGGFAASYATAVGDGAEFVIGPLLKEDLAAFDTGLTVSVPTLALNFFQTTSAAREHLYTFGLDANDEAEQLAREARANGYRQVLVLSDGSQISQRQGERFRDYWRNHADGEIIDTLVLEDINVLRKDFDRMLLTRESRQRIAALQNLLGRELVSEPRRRQDLELLVMFANPTAARSLRPLVSFLYAGDLPLWATSQSHAAQPDQRGNRDLEAVQFLDAPWFSTAEKTLRTMLDREAAPGGMQRFAALGADANRLQSRTGLLDWINTLGLGGATGELSLDAQRKLHRRSSWYVFKQGRVVARSPRPEIAAAVHGNGLSTEGGTPWSQEDPANAARLP